MLSEASGSEELENSYRDRLDEWADLVGSSDALERWDRAEFWEVAGSLGTGCSVPTRAFLDAWLDIALAPGGAATVESNDRAHNLIKDRELARKRAQARLSNRRALELWGGAAGADRLAYRWPGTQLVLSDILEGLEREPGA